MEERERARQPGSSWGSSGAARRSRSPRRSWSARRAVVGRFALALESPESVLDRGLGLAQHGLALDYWDSYPARVQAVTPEDIQRVARRYLAADRVQLIAIGERTRIEPALKEIGPVEVIDPAVRQVK